MVTIRTDLELKEAYSLMCEMGSSFLKLLISEDAEAARVIESDTSAVSAPVEAMANMQIEEEEKAEPEAPQEKKCKWWKKCGAPWKKHKKFAKFRQGRWLQQITGVLRQVIREEVGYALRGETPPEIEPFNFCPPWMNSDENEECPQEAGRGHCGRFNWRKFTKRFGKKPKFDVIEQCHFEESVRSGDELTQTWTIYNKSNLPIPAGTTI